MDQIISESTLQPLETVRWNVCRRSREKTYVASVALDRRALADVFRVRYASYLDSGFIKPNPEKLFSDRFDGGSNTTTILVHEGEKPVASVRVCFMSRSLRNAPAHHAFPAEVNAILSEAPRSGKKYDVAEITRLVRSPDCASNQGLVFLLYRIAALFILEHDVHAVLSSVRQNHVAFYTRLGFRPVAGPRPYPGLNCPMHLMQCPRSAYDQARAAFPRIDPDAAPPGTFDGFLQGQPVIMPLTFRD